MLKHSMRLLCVLLSLYAPRLQAEPGWIYQTAPIAGLMAGLYDGAARCNGFVDKTSSVGLGTFDQLDGEMVVLDGRIYAVRESGAVEQLRDCTTPFATVASFSRDAKKAQWQQLDLSQIEAAIDELYPSQNLPVLIKLTGDFNAVTVRVAPKQKKPYVKLVDAVKNQPVFSRAKVSGTLVGFRLPSYLSGINVPGYHFHFISADAAFGGHVFKLELISGTAKTEEARGLRMLIPSNPPFKAANLQTVSEADISKVERQR